MIVQFFAVIGLTFVILWLVRRLKNLNQPQLIRSNKETMAKVDKLDALMGDLGIEERLLLLSSLLGTCEISVRADYEGFKIFNITTFTDDASTDSQLQKLTG